MQGYRLYLMRDGHIRSAREFLAESDVEAVARAEEMRRGEPAELWRRSHLICALGTRAERPETVAKSAPLQTR